LNLLLRPEQEHRFSFRLTLNTLRLFEYAPNVRFEQLKRI
jgi:hypothetical protein